MRKLTGAVFQSLDGVMQAPGGPDEDPTSGFQYGGWSFHFWDESLEEPFGKVIDADYDLLLGKRTYDIFAAYWPHNQEMEIGARFQFDEQYRPRVFDRVLEAFVTIVRALKEDRVAVFDKFMQPAFRGCPPRERIGRDGLRFVIYHDGVVRGGRAEFIAGLHIRCVNEGAGINQPGHATRREFD